MAIQTETIIDVMVGDVKVDEFGVSDTLDNYTDSDIADFLYVGSNSRILGGNIDFYAANAGSYDVWNAGMPFNTGSVTSSIMTMKSGDGVYDCPSEGRYLGIILLHSTNDIYTDYITVSNSDGYVILTEFNAKKFLLEINAALTQVASEGATSFTDKTNTLYNPDFTSIALKYNNGGTYVNTAYAIVPYHVLEYGGYLYLIHAFKENKTAEFRCSFNTSPIWNAGTVYYPVSYNDISKSISVSFNGYGFGSGWSTISPDDFVWSYNGSSLEKYSDSDYVWIRTAFSQRQFRCYYYFKSYNDCMMMFANSGMYFRINGDTIFKPLIDNNVVYGFTDQLDAASDIDNYDGSTKHDIPVTPPTPPTPPVPGTDEDNDDPIPTVGAPYASGLSRYYVTTAASPILAHISEAFGAWNLKDTGKDLYRNIISCKLIKSPAPIPVSGSEPFTVYGVTLQYEGSDITLPVVNDNPTASFGSYNIPRKFYDFRDYAPYTKVEIYLPYCGWTVLPSHVVGRSVSVTYYTDIIAATCKAVVYCNSNVVAEAAGVIGLDIPMVTENAGAKGEAVSMGLLAYGKAGLQTALGVGAAVATKGKAGVKSAVGGLENLVSAYSQTAMAFNQNYTEINGKNGDGCCIAGISAIVIKITRPKYGANTTAPYVPSNYGHSTGFVSMKSATVGSFTGLLVADNVDTSGISGATDREKQLIKLYLESGIYVNHPN